MQYGLSQNEEEATKILHFVIREKDGFIRDANSMEECVKCIKEFEIPMDKEFIDSFNKDDFSELSAVSKVLCYLNIAYNMLEIKSTQWLTIS